MSRYAQLLGKSKTTLSILSWLFGDMPRANTHLKCQGKAPRRSADGTYHCIQHQVYSMVDSGQRVEVGHIKKLSI